MRSDLSKVSIETTGWSPTFFYIDYYRALFYSQSSRDIDEEFALTGDRRRMALFVVKTIV